MRSTSASFAAARRHYRAYLRACLMEDDRPLQEAMRASRYAIGSQQYVLQIEGALKKRRTGRAADRDVALPPERVDLKLIGRAVAAEYGIKPDDLRRHGSRAGEAKAVALELACRRSGHNQRQIGRHYGKITSMAVCMARLRFREDQAEENPALQRVLGKLDARITREGETEYLESDPDFRSVIGCPPPVGSVFPVFPLDFSPATDENRRKVEVGPRPATMSIT